MSSNPHMPKSKPRRLKVLHWGPFPDEMDGGAAVNYWLWRMAYRLMPNYTHFAIPKNPEELVPQKMPFMNYIQIRSEEDVPKHMLARKIPVIESFHLPERLDKVVDGIHDIGGTIVLHQTIHWSDDQVFKMQHLNDVDWIVTPTNWAKKQLVFHGKVGTDKIIYIPHAVDTEKFFPRKMTPLRKRLGLENKIVILFAGRYGTWKGLHNFIPLIRPFTENFNCAFLIRASSFGSADSQSVRMHELFRRMATSNKNLILLDKWLPYDMIPEVVASADIACNPSGHEGFNVPNLEAMASGKPVATSDLPNHVEIVGNDAGLFMESADKVGIVNADPSTGHAGTEVKVPSANTIAAALKFLIENPEEREAMGEAGRKRAEKEYSLAFVADTWLRLFEKIGTYDMEERARKRLLKL